MARNESRNIRVCCAGIWRRARESSQTKKLTTRKKHVSTIGDIQTIGRETWIIGPQRAQLILSNSSSPMPSISPVAIPNQTAIKTVKASRGGFGRATCRAPERTGVSERLGVDMSVAAYATRPVFIALA